MLDIRGRFLEAAEGAQLYRCFSAVQRFRTGNRSADKQSRVLRGITAEGAEIIERTNGLYKPL